MRLFDDEHPSPSLYSWMRIIFHHLNCYMVVSTLYQAGSVTVFRHRSVFTESTSVGVLPYCWVPVRLHQHKGAECFSAKPAFFSLSTHRMTWIPSLGIRRILLIKESLELKSKGGSDTDQSFVKWLSLRKSSSGRKKSIRLLYYDLCLYFFFMVYTFSLVCADFIMFKTHN